MTPVMASEIRWGTGFDNIIAFEPFPTDGSDPHSLDDVVTWRRPAPGSRRMRNPAGTTDSWIAKRDFMLAGVARYFPRRSWSGLGLQDFLDWASEGNAFRLLPDRRYPSFYIDSCILEEPFDDPRPHLEDTDGSQSIDIVIRQQALDFSVAMRGLLFEYVPSKSLVDPAAATFARNTTANRIGRDGVLASEAVDVLRTRHFLNGVQVALLEKTSDNLVLQSENFGTTWAPINSPTRVAATHTASGVTLDLIGDDSAVLTKGYSQSVAFTGDGVKALSLFVRQGTSVQSVVFLRDTTTSQSRIAAEVSWPSGLPAVVMTGGFGTYLGYEALYDGVFRLLFASDSLTAANNHVIEVLPAAAIGGDATRQGTLTVGGVQAENSARPTSYKKTTTVTVTRGDDVLRFPHAFIPQTMTVYLKFIELGTISVGGCLFELADTLGQSPLFRVHASSSVYRAHFTTLTDSSLSTMGAAPSYGQTVELRATFSATGQAQIAQTINGGSETVAAAGGNGLLPAAWSAALLHLAAAGEVKPLTGLLVAKVAAGVKTLAEMRAA